MVSFQLRPATQDDYDFMKRVGHDGLRPHVEAYRTWNQDIEDEGFRQIFDPHRQSIVVAEGVDAGYVHLVEDAEGLWIAGIYLDGPHRARGLGGAVLNQLVDQAHLEGLPIRLRVHKTNPAVTLYQRYGFQVETESETQFVMVRYPAVSVSSPISVSSN